MYISHGRANLFVAVTVDVLQKEVDKTPIALQNREDPQVRPGRHACEERLNPHRKIGLGQNSPKGLEGKHESVQG
jgi:hypothetical protein